MRNYIDQKTKTIGGAGHIVRALADSSDMGATWGPVRFAASLPDPICFSDLLRYPNATCPPIFSATFRPFCTVLSLFFCGFRLPGAETERTGEKWRKMGEIWGRNGRETAVAEWRWAQGLRAVGGRGHLDQRPGQA